MALKSDDNLTTLVLDYQSAIDVLIAIEYEMSQRGKSGQPMQERLSKVAQQIKNHLNLAD